MAKQFGSEITKYAKLLENTKIHVKHSVFRVERHQIKQHLPPHVHMHQLWPWVIGERAELLYK